MATQTLPLQGPESREESKQQQNSCLLRVPKVRRNPKWLHVPGRLGVC